MGESLNGTALIVGINAYSGGVKPLHSAVADAQALADCLRDQHGYEVSLLLDAAASAAAILDAIEAVGSRRPEQDGAFLLYFAGHGVARGDGSEGPQGFLLPVEATLGDQQSWLSMDRLRKAIEGLPSRHLLVILDCCFAGSFRWASTRDVVLQAGPLYDSQYERFLQGTAWQALTSASHNETAMDISPGYANTRDHRLSRASSTSHSPFALALIRGLGGDADSSRGGHAPDGVITATELFQYAFAEFGSAGEMLRQTPGIWPLRPDNTGEYVFLNPQQPRKTLPDPPLDDANNPWMGLNAYASEHAPLLFGREQCIARIIERINDRERPRLVSVIGASGTGKSSVVKAGVLPRLEQPGTADAAIGGWSVVRSSRIGSDPGSSLRRARVELEARAEADQRLLFIDQFEELYTQCQDPALRENYLEQLRQLIDGGITVVITLRSDFEPQPARSAALAELWAAARIVIPAFSGEELRQCIEGPAAVRALYFEPEALVGELVDEVMAMPGALPMLSFALAEMYRCAQQRRRRTGSNDRALMREDQEATGGVIGALHRRASALFDAGTPEIQRTIRLVFLRMIAQDGARLTRRRIALAELEYAAPEQRARVAEVQKAFVDARLLVVDGDSIEPAHDTLVVAWDKLLEWLSAAGPQDLIRAVWRAALDWQQGGASAGMTWHDDPRLPLALSQRNQLNALEQQFIDASETQRKRRINRAIGIAAATGIVILASAVLAWQQRNHAVAQEQIALEQEARAEQQRDRALASALLANAQAQSDPVIKGLTVAEIAPRNLPPPARADAVARQAFDQMTGVDGHAYLNGTGWDIRQVRGPNYISFQTLLGSRVEDSWSFEPIHFRTRAAHGRVLANAFTSNERSVYASYEEGITVFWPDPLVSDVTISITEPVAGLAADASGNRVALAVGNEARLLDIDPASGAVVTRLIGRHAAELSSIALTPDARWAATGSTDGDVRLWDLASGELVQQRRLAHGVTSVALGRGADALAAGTTAGTVRLWRGQAIDATEQVGQCDGTVQMLTLAPNSAALAAVCSGQAWVWNSSDLAHATHYPSNALRRVKFVLWPDSFYPGGPWPEAFSHDGLWLIGLGVPQPPVAWPVVTAPILPGVVPEPPARSTVAQAAIGFQGLESWDESTESALEDAEDPTASISIASTSTVTGHRVDFDLTPMPDGAEEVRISLSDPGADPGVLERRSEQFELPWGIQPDRFPVVVDPAGGHILAVASDGNFWAAVLFDLGTRSGAIASNHRLEGTLLRDALFSPDGSQLLILSNRMNPNVIHADPVLYNSANLAEFRALGGQRFVSHAAFSADGSRIVTTDCYGESRIWNADGSGDPIVIDGRNELSVYLCGEDEGEYSAAVLPRAWFSADGGYLLTQHSDEPPAMQIIGLAALSEQIQHRTFACLSAAQREQFLAESPEQARAEYDRCMAQLAGSIGSNESAP